MTAGSTEATAGKATAGSGKGAVRGLLTTLLPLLIGSFMSLLDTTIVNVALPSIGVGLGAGQSQLAWVVSGYALAFGLILIPAGRLGDLYGHRTLFCIGVSLFTLFSLGAGLARDPTQLVALRVLQGLGAGLYFPATAAFIQILFRGSDRGRAFGLFGSVIGFSTAVGPLLGGAIIQLAGSADGWRGIFFVNVPIGVIVVGLALKLLPGRDAQGEPEGHGSLRDRLDPVGLVLLVITGVALLLPLVEGQQLGWPLWTWSSFVVAAVAGIVLWRWETRVERTDALPIVPVHLFQQTSFAAGTAVALAYFAAFTSVFFTISILWQEGLGHTALETGLIATPFALGSLVSAANSNRVAQRLGRWVLTLGVGLVIVGLTLVLLMLLRGGADPNPWTLVVPLLIAGSGNGLFIAPNTTFILATVDPKEAGSSSGVLNTVQRVGSSIGIAVVSSVLFGTLVIGQDGPAPAFLHSAELALAVNTGLAVVAFCLIFALPRRVEGSQ